MKSRKPPLSTTHPHLAQEWHPGNDKTPSEVTAGSKYRAKWECRKDSYMWEAAVSNRTINGSGCPLCANRVVMAGVNDLASKFPELVKEWHPDNDRIPSEVSPGAGYRAKWVCAKGHTWDTSVCNRTGDTFRTGCPVCAGKAVAKGVNDIATQYPELAKEWSPRNDLRAEEVSPGSNKRVEWMCAAGHMWETSPASRVKQGSGCGKCSGRHVDIGVNDLATLYSDLAQEWSEDNPKPASAYRPGSNYVAAWVCSEGHTWKTAIANRTKQGTGCPVCGNKEVIRGINDFATKHPLLAKQWGNSNTKLPSEVTYGSMYRAEWVCSKGHRWDAFVSTRAKGAGCPYCSGRRAIPGETDVLTTHPHLAAEWSPDNNFGLDSVSAGSDARGKWVCASKGHVWTTQVKHRTLRGQGCPECARTMFSSKGEKELAELIRETLHGDTVLTTHRGVARAGELDIYIPSMSLAFEFNGVYYHSDALGRDKNSHYNKFRACERAGVRLVVVWEDDWRDRREVVEKMVRAKLGLSPKHLVGARSLVVDTDVPYAEVERLLASEHIQGPIKGSVHLGLRSRDGELLAVMVGSMRKNTMIMSRFASKSSITGGFSRLLSTLKAHAVARGASLLVTYSDNAVSDGGTYSRYGFTRAWDVVPKYGVTWRSKRYHSSSFKRSRFQKDPDLMYVEGARLVDLYELNNMHRVWDYGKVRWELPLV